MTRILAIIFCGIFALAPAFAQDRMSEIIRLIDAGAFDAAQDKIDEAPISELDLQYLNARAELVKQNWDAAIEQFRALLKQQPKFHLARAGLAQALEAKGQNVAAEIQYRKLIVMDKNPRLRALYRQSVLRVAGKKRVGLSGFVTVAPSQNINRSTFNTSFDSFLGSLSIDETQRSGVGLSAGVNGFFRTDPGRKSQLRADWSLSGKDYRGKDLDSYSSYLGALYIHSGEKGSISFGPYYRETWDHDGDAEDEGLPYGIKSKSNGLKFGLGRKVSDKSTLRFSLTHERIDDLRKDGLDGLYRSASFSWRKVVDRITFVEANVTLTDLDRNVVYNGYWGQEARFTFGRILPGNIRGEVGVYAGVRDYKDIFAFRDFVRRDEYKGLTIDATFNQYQVLSFTPKVGCRFEGGRSNIEFGDVNIRECAFSLSQNF